MKSSRCAMAIEHLETELEKFQSRDGLGEYHTGSLH